MAYRIAKAKKPFAIGEELILPAVKNICGKLLGEATVKNIEKVPLLNTTIKRRISAIAEDIESQLLDRVDRSPWYAIAVDESTDLESKAIILVHLRYICQEDIYEDMLCALSLPSKTTAAVLLRVLDSCVSGHLNWSFCVGICTDGAAAMTEHISGLIARVKEVAPKCESIHYVVHREMLASRKMQPALSEVLNDVINVIDYNKANVLNSRLSELFCEEMEAEHKRPLLRTTVQWLSKGRLFSRVFELWEPVHRFLSEKNSPLAANHSNQEWIAKLAYLCDIFTLLNELNLFLQEKRTTAFQLADKIAAFKAKMELLAGERWVKAGIIDVF